MNCELCRKEMTENEGLVLTDCKVGEVAFCLKCMLRIAKVLPRLYVERYGPIEEEEKS